MFCLARIAEHNRIRKFIQVRRLNATDAKEALRQLLAPCSVTLKNPKSIENVILILETMKSVFSSLGRVGRDVDRSVGETVYRMMETIWADLTRLSNQHCKNAKFAEKLCGCHKYMIRFLGSEYFKNFAQSFCKQMADLFQKSGQSSFLYASGIAVESLSNVSEARGMLSQMLFHFTNTVLSICSNENSVRNNPDITEDFFDFCGRYVKYCPDLLLGSPNLERCAAKIFDFAIFSLRVEHREANRSAIFFLQDVLKLGTKEKSNMSNNRRVATEGMRKLLHAYSPKLAEMFFIIIAGSLPVQRVDDEDASITRILLALCKLLPAEQFHKMIEFGLSKLPKESVPQQEKQRLMNDFFGDRGVFRNPNIHAWNRVVVSFSRSCRRYQRRTGNSSGSGSKKP